MASFKNLKITPDSMRKAKDWFKKKINDLHFNATFHGVGHSKVNIPVPGHMFLFNYDAKLKRDLPYWDTHPLVLPFNVKSDRFWGLNLHYLPYEYRLQLLASLNNLVIDSKISDQKKMEMSWQILKSASRINLIKPCVHSYLFTGNHIQSNFLMIDSEEWYQAALLPMEAFKGRDKTSDKEKYINVDKKTVWRDSLK